MNHLNNHQLFRPFVLAILFLVSFTMAEIASAQNPESVRSISGRVADASGQGIPGVGIIVKGTTMGVITTDDGSFALQNVSDGSTIVVSCMGYVEQEFRIISTKSVYNVVLSEDEMLLDDVVVVGYGTQKKEHLTGAVAQVTAKELENRPVANLGQALQGMVPNLKVTVSSGKPGAGASFQIRGTGSPNGGSPLILVDGVESYPDRINTNDIESISVLKDAASSAIYGAKAAFGVILITTKNGRKNQKATISYDGYFAFSSSTTSTDYETRGYYSAGIADFFMESGRGVRYTNYTDADYKALWVRRNDKTENPERPWVTIENRFGRQSYVYLANFDWFNYLYNLSRPTTDHNVSISGGSDKMTYLISGRYYSQEGVQKLGDDGYKSFNIRSNISIDVRHWLEVKNTTRMFSGRYTFSGVEGESTNWRRPGMHCLASFVPMNPDGTSVAYTSLTYSSTHFPSDGWVAMMQQGGTGGHNLTQEMSTKFDFIFKIHKNLKVQADFGYKKGYLRNDYREMDVKYSKYPGEVDTMTTNYSDSYKEVVYDQNLYTANAFANYKNDWNGHNLEITAGFNYETRRHRDLKAKREDLLTKELSDFNLAVGEVSELTGGRDERATAGIFYRAAYNYKGRYLFEVDGRYDGSSKFPRGDRFGFFPSFSLGYRISEEKFFEPLRNVVDNLKLRASYGTLGNQDVGSYDYIQSINTQKVMGNYTFDKVSGADYAYADNPVSGALTWEKVIHKNVGLDLSMLSSRLNLSFDAYIRDVKGILTQGKSLPSIYGAAEPMVNANDIRTKGWELTFGWRDSFKIAGRPFHYSLSATLADYKAKYTKVDNPSGILSDPYVGKEVGEIWGYRVAGLFKTTAEAQEYASKINLTEVCYDYFRSDAGVYGRGIQAGDMKFLDLNGDNVVNGGAGTLDNPGDRVKIGNSNPRYTYGLNLAFEWLGFDVSAFFQGVGHQDLYPANDNIKFWGPYVRPFASFIPRNFMSNVWSENNTDAYFPRARAYSARDSKHSLRNVNDRYMQNLAYCRLKNFTLGYSLPEQWISKAGLSKCRIYFSGENLFYWTKLHNDFIDPEQATTSSGNSDVYPWYKTFAFGINLTF